MQYFTKDEAKRVIGNFPVRLCVWDDSNPNRNALQAAYELSAGEDTHWAIMVGFQIGVAIGKRMERARKSGKHTEDKT